jgi:hypothetical protein
LGKVETIYYLIVFSSNIRHGTNCIRTIENGRVCLDTLLWLLTLFGF